VAHRVCGNLPCQQGMGTLCDGILSHQHVLRGWTQRNQ
jgi:hypothetical protein